MIVNSAVCIMILVFKIMISGFSVMDSSFTIDCLHITISASFFKIINKR